MYLPCGTTVVRYYVGTEKEFLKNFAAGLISLFQRPTFPRVAVWYPVSDGGDTFPNCKLPALKDPDLTFRNTPLTQMGEDCIISIDRKRIKFLRVLEALHQ